MADQATQYLRPGYKLTEIGVIPSEWEVDTVASTTPKNAKNGIVDGPFGSNLKTIHYRKSGIPIITSGYVTEGVFLATDYLYVDVAKFNQEKRSAVRSGDIVMAKIGARCGASAILPASHQTGILSGNALKITVDNDRHSTYYIWQVLWSLYSSGNIEALKTVGAQPAISMSNLKKHQVPLPPLSEQTAIATALSDADALISSSEELIAKKRYIKQGAMQELLTGKKRLPGFTGKWETESFEQVFKKYNSKNYQIQTTEYSESGLYPVIDQGKSQIVAYSDQTDKLFHCPRSGVIIFGDHTRIVKFADFDFLVGADGTQLLTSKEGHDTKYYYYQLCIKEIPNTGYNRHFKFLKELIFPRPSLPEQVAIATVLTDMDAEIEKLEQKLQKHTQLKQGMMQVLLTGKIRLLRN